MSNDFKNRQITDMLMVIYNQPFPFYNKETCVGAKLTSVVSYLMISGSQLAGQEMKLIRQRENILKLHKQFSWLYFDYNIPPTNFDLNFMN